MCTIVFQLESPVKRTKSTREDAPTTTSVVRSASLPASKKQGENYNRSNAQHLSSPVRNYSNNILPVINPERSSALEYSSRSNLIQRPSLTVPASRTDTCLASLVLMATSVGLANIWRLPTVVYTNYPGILLISNICLPIIIILLLVCWCRGVFDRLHPFNDHRWFTCVHHGARTRPIFWFGNRTNMAGCPLIQRLVRLN